ncbi:MAG: hypothetical protein ACOYXY_22445 [Thermodesulfobacteriota bacterium]
MNNVRQVFALVVDLIGSTQQGLHMAEPRLRRFNREVVGHLWPYLKELDLEDSETKFTGDGWLIFNSDTSKLRAMVALAKTLSSRFQTDIAEKMEVEKTEIPDLRLAMAAAYDDEITLPNGAREWVGDSARMATRASACCAPNQLIVTTAIRDKIRREFVLKEVHIEDLPEARQPRKWEENLQIYSVEELNPNLVSDIRFADDPSEFAPYAVYLKHVGRSEDAMKLLGEAGSTLRRQLQEASIVTVETAATTFKAHGADVVSERFVRLVGAASTWEMRDDLVRLASELGAPLSTSQYNRLIHKSATPAEALAWFKRMTDLAVPPDVVTYNTLINLSPDLPTAEAWFKRMTDSAVPPNVVTYNTLINLSPDLPTAEAWFKRMTDSGVAKTEVATSALAAKIKTLADANHLTTILQEAGAYVGESYYAAIYARIACSLSGQELLNWHFQQKYKWIPALESAIKAYAVLGRMEDSFRIALAFPYLAAAGKVFRQHGDAAATYYARLLEVDFEPFNATYALGVCFMENNRDSEALQMLRRAYTLATTEKRKDDILRRIADIEAGGSDSAS